MADAVTPPASAATERRGGDDSERTFQWFTPARRRASVYEDVTIDTQPGRHVVRGWPMWFDDGRSTWDERSTRLRSTDWYDFRDPAQLWERPFYQMGAGLEREIEHAVRSSARDRLFDDFDPIWVEFLRDHLQVPAFVEHGLWYATATAARDCLSDSITTCVVIEAAMKQRLAQAIVLYAMDLEPYLGELPVERGKQHFLEDDVWEPTRRYIEKLWTLTDWGERIVAVNLCFEPLVGVMLRREFGIRAARANGDTVTSVIARTGQIEWDWVRDWTAELMRFLLADAAHGAHNREVLGGWLERWLPAAAEALDAIAPLAARLPQATALEGSRERVEHDSRTLLAESGLQEMAEVAGG